MDESSEHLSEFALLPIRGDAIAGPQWAEVVACSDLPPEARPLVERAIAMYRIGREVVDTTPIPSETRKSLLGLAKRVDVLHSEFEALSKDRSAVLALALADEHGNHARQDAVRARCRNIAQNFEVLSRWLHKAHSVVAPGHSGAHREAIVIALFVATLDKILMQFTSKGITRSNKGKHPTREFIQKLCRIADPGLGNGAIEQAMKQVIKGRGKIVDEQGS